MPFIDAYRDRPNERGAGFARLAFDVVADWAVSLQGGVEFPKALVQLSRLFGADAGLVLRHDENSERHRQAAVVEAAGKSVVAIGRRQSLSRDILGKSLASLKTGAVWVLSEMRRDMAFADEHWIDERLAASGIKDIVVLVLSSKSGCVDCCEFQYGHALLRQERDRIEELAPALIRSWNGRLPGTVERLISSRKQRSQKPLSADLLHPSNPAGLSRSEYRVCMLVREGLLARAVAEELSICESTVRSHLRSIYSKTGVSGHVDLLHRLTRPQQAASDDGAHAGAARIPKGSAVV